MRVTTHYKLSGPSRLTRAALAIINVVAALALAALSGAQAYAQAAGKIAYEQYGAVWVMDADGSNKTQITPFGFDPAFSPDGTKIAFRCGDGDQHNYICVMNADGTNFTALVEDGFNFDPAWSPDGTKIAFTRATNGSNYRIYVINADGSGLAQLWADNTDPSSDNTQTSPAWSPDGTKVAYTNGMYPQQHIVVRNVDGSDERVLTTSAGTNDAPAFSPDGRYVVYSNLNNILFARLDPNDPVIPAIPGGDNTMYADPTYSQDGSKLAYFREITTRVEDPNGNTDIIRESDLYVRAGGVSTGLNCKDCFDPSFQPEVESYNTPKGQNVSVTLGGVTVNFSEVTTAGNTTVEPISPGSAGQLPGGYRIGGSSIAFEIKTTAAYTGPITITFNVTAPTPQAFSRLRVLHGEGSPLQLVDRTVLAPDQPAPSYELGQISARTASLSPFVVAELEPANTAPVAHAKNVVVNAGNNCSAQVAAADIDNGSYDPDGDSITLSISPAGPFSVGEHIVTLTVTDEQGASSTAPATIKVVDNNAPSVSAALIRVQGHGHREGRFRVKVSASDKCDASPSLVAVMAAPEAHGFAVVFEQSQGIESSVKFDLRKRRVILSGASRAEMMALLAAIVADGGARVTDGQQLSLHLSNKGDDDQYQLIFVGGQLVRVKGAGPLLRATATDASGNTASATAKPAF